MCERARACVCACMCVCMRMCICVCARARGKHLRTCACVLARESISAYSTKQCPGRLALVPVSQIPRPPSPAFILLVRDWVAVPG